LTDKGKRSNEDRGRNVAKRRNELTPPFQRRVTVWGTGAAKRQHDLLAAGPASMWRYRVVLPCREESIEVNRTLENPWR
jgi:hypothetical protein